MCVWGGSNENLDSPRWCFVELTPLSPSSSGSYTLMIHTPIVQSLYLVEPQRQAGTTQNIYYQLIITNLTVVPLTNELNIILINNK